MTAQSGVALTLTNVGSGINDTVFRQALNGLSPVISNFQQSRASQIAQAAYSDAGAGFETAWASTAGWYPTTAFQVSGGKMYSNGSGTASGATLTGYTIAPYQNARLMMLVNNTGGSGTNGVLFGVSSDASGATPAAASANAYCLEFTDNGHAYQWTLGANVQIANPLATPSTTPFPTGQYLVCVEVDETYISIVAAQVGNTYVEARSQWARPAGVSLIPYLFNSDSNQLTGNSVGLYSAKIGDASGRKGFGITPLGKSVIWTNVPITYAPSGVTNINLKVQVPPNYDSRTTYPVLFFCHGYGGSEHDLTDDAYFQTMNNIFVTSGYIVASPSFAATQQNNWGAQSFLDGAAAAYRYLRDHFNIGPVVLMGSSMGGIQSLNLLADRTIPNIVAYIGKSPTYNFFNCYISVTSGLGQNGAGALGFGGSMDSAYNAVTGTMTSPCTPGTTTIQSSVSYASGDQLIIDAGNGTAGVAEFVTVTGAPTGTGPYAIPITATVNGHAAGATLSDLPAKILGNASIPIPSVIGSPTHDPSAMVQTAFRGVPMFIATATDDVTVYPAANGFALAAAVAGIAPEVYSYPGITGGHAFTVSTIVGRTMLEFADKWCGR